MLVERNRQTLANDSIELAGQSLVRWQREARTALVAQACTYTAQYRSPAWPSDVGSIAPILLAGHQPDLFHPGVWLKNFALSALAERLGAVAINLVVDNDLSRGHSVRLPIVRDGSLLSEPMAVDRAGEGVPFEQATIRDRSCFESFGRRASAAIGQLVRHPLLESLWPLAIEASHRTSNLGIALAQARHRLEDSIGLKTLELPLSALCGSRPFVALALSIGGELPRFHEAYNGALTDYRAARRIRSAAHPVPALEDREGWLEAPFWVYSDQSPRRRPVWVRSCGSGIEWSDLQSLRWCVPSPSDSPRAVDEMIDGLQQQSIKLRPRALVTTIFARLMLCDLFVHGIGGGTYDQLTDQIITRYFGIVPPEFMVVSGTALLPGAGDPRVPMQTVLHLERQQRELRFAPDRLLMRSPLPQSLLHAKAQLLAEIPPRGQKLDWHQQLAAINDELTSRLAGVDQQLTDELRVAREQLRQSQILASREHPFCIYPADGLVPILQRLANVDARGASSDR
jgi:hypothetical protein